MATICGAALAAVAARVPLSNLVAGVAIGAYIDHRNEHIDTDKDVAPESKKQQGGLLSTIGSWFGIGTDTSDEVEDDQVGVKKNLTACDDGWYSIVCWVKFVDYTTEVRPPDGYSRHGGPLWRHGL